MVGGKARQAREKGDWMAHPVDMQGLLDPEEDTGRKEAELS